MKKKTPLLHIILILIVLLFFITGCRNKEENVQGENVQNQNIVQENANLNPELNGVVGFAEKIDGENSSKIVALKNDGTEIEITKADTNEYDTLTYYAGKIYLKRKKNFYEVDLTNGDGNYKVSKIFGYPMDTNNYYDRYNFNYIYVYEGKLYFLKDTDELIEYDLKTKKVNELIKDVDYIDFRMDKENGIIYYVEQNSKYALKSYNIKTKETKQIEEGASRSYQYSSKSTNLPIEFVGIGVNQGKILYSKGEFDEEGTSIFDTYLYDIKSGEKEKIDDINTGIYSDGKLYYSATLQSSEPYPPKDLKVYENRNISEISEYQENDYTKFYDLGNGKIQAVMYWGQDISTYGEQAYTIDKKTNEVMKSDLNYSMAYLIQNVDNAPKVESKETVENKITIEKAEEIIKNKWGIEPDNNNQAIPEANSYILQGGKLDFTIRDTDGLEYYVFSYYSKVGETSGEYHNTHIQTIFISVDGKKYKIRSLGDNFEDKDVVTQFDEEGEI